MLRYLPIYIGIKNDAQICLLVQDSLCDGLHRLLVLGIRDMVWEHTLLPEETNSIQIAMEMLKSVNAGNSTLTSPKFNIMHPSSLNHTHKTCLLTALKQHGRDLDSNNLNNYLHYAKSFLLHARTIRLQKLTSGGNCSQWLKNSSLHSYSAYTQLSGSRFQP